MKLIEDIRKINKTIEYLRHARDHAKLAIDSYLKIPKPFLVAQFHIIKNKSDVLLKIDDGQIMKQDDQQKIDHLQRLKNKKAKKKAQKYLTIVLDHDGESEEFCKEARKKAINTIFEPQQLHDEGRNSVIKSKAKADYAGKVGYEMPRISKFGNNPKIEVKGAQVFMQSHIVLIS